MDTEASFAMPAGAAGAAAHGHRLGTAEPRVEVEDATAAFFLAALSLATCGRQPGRTTAWAKKVEKAAMKKKTGAVPWGLLQANLLFRQHFGKPKQRPCGRPRTRPQQQVGLKLPSALHLSKWKVLLQHWLKRRNWRRCYYWGMLACAWVRLDPRLVPFFQARGGTSIPPTGTRAGEANASKGAKARCRAITGWSSNHGRAQRMQS